MKKILARLIEFRDSRNWSQFHTPENLAKSIVIESSELLVNYQFGEDSFDVNNVQDELADIMGYCLLLADHYGLNIETIMNQKIDKNEKKYPVDKAYNTAKKYTKL